MKIRDCVRICCTIGLVAALVVGWSGEASSTVAAARTVLLPHVTTKGVIPRSDLSCNSDQIPVYDGTNLVCGQVSQLQPFSYEVAPVGQMIGDIWGLQYVYQIAGGHLNSRTGKGEILLAQGGRPRSRMRTSTPNSWH